MKFDLKIGKLHIATNNDVLAAFYLAVLCFIGYQTMDFIVTSLTEVMGG